MSVIRHFEATPDERAAYLKMRRLMAGVTEEAEGGEVLGDTPDPDAPTAEDVAGGAEEQARGRTPMLAARRSTRAAPGSPEVRRGGAEGRPASVSSPWAAFP